MSSMDGHGQQIAACKMFDRMKRGGRWTLIGRPAHYQVEHILERRYMAKNGGGVLHCRRALDQTHVDKEAGATRKQPLKH